ncbi:MAG: RtcB family protein [Parachlamydiaceae bacterium]|nr:RtcB family protein [Parachlamydiaceae bacterium]
MFNLTKIAPSTYLLPQEEGMRVPGLIIANEELINVSDFEKPLEQVRNVAYLPGIVGYSIAMPDIHWGYGFPIGGVAAMDAEHGVISPGGVGYDINCGVRLAVVPRPFKDLSEFDRQNLLKSIFKNVPSGVGGQHKKIKELSHSDYKKLLEEGARWSVDNGFGLESDLDFTESHGMITGADIDSVSKYAQDRGKYQLGTIGSGNHFVEIGEISELYLPDIAKAWGVFAGQTYILIHSGSRGFGHQICQEALNSFVKLGYAKGLPDKQLIAAPIHSDAGKNYFRAMAAAANFAFNNRQQILHKVRLSFREVLGIPFEEVRLLYDVCHNIAKFERHLVDGKMRKLCVHRKGATRAFGPGNEELSPLYRTTGQPVLVPGDMGRASHLMVGQDNPLTWCSSCHGAGRAQGRHKGLESWRGRDPVKHMKAQGVTVMASSMKTIAEEMPDAYKDVDSVVMTCQEAGLAKMVAKLKPSLVIKG